MANDLNPEILSQMLSLGGLSEEEGRLAEQMTNARALKYAPMEKGQMIGDVYVKANPLQHALTAMRGMEGRQTEADINRRLGQISGQRTAARGAMAKAIPTEEPDAYSILAAPDEPTAQRSVEALKQAISRRRQVGTAGMLSGDPTLGKVGAGLVGEAQQGSQALGEAGQTRQKMALQAQIEARKAEDESIRQGLSNRRLDVQEQMQREQLQIAKQRVALENRRLGQDVYSAIADPVSGGIIKYNKKTGEATPLTGSATPGGKQPYLKPLSETQGQAAMFLRQSENALKQAMSMGERILPASGMAGGKEKAAWFAREHGVPQLSSRDELARQSLLLSIAEPIVRSESGAAVPPEEIRRLALRYVPSPGEPKEEQARKLRSLVGAIRSVQEKLPPAKAAEFNQFFDQAQAWAADILGEGGSPGVAPIANPDSYYE